MEWIRILLPADLKNNDFIRLINANGKKLCIIKSEGKVYATQSKCPHAGADLSEGWCKKSKIICPYHRYEYDLETGRGANGQGDYINIYPIDVRDDGVYVGFKKPWWKF